MSEKDTEKISDKKMFWRIAGTGWIIFLLCFILSLFEWYDMIGLKAIVFSGISFLFSCIFTGLAVEEKEENKSIDKSES